MEGVGTALLFVLLLAVAGVVVYLAVDYTKYKTDTDKSLTETKTATTTNTSGLADEKSTRLANIKYVVDQVNDVNDQIYNNWSSNVTALQGTTAGLRTDLTRAQAEQTMLMRGIDTFFKVQVPATPATPYSLWRFDSNVAAPDLQLLKHVTALGGLTAANLEPGNAGASLQFCGKAAAGGGAAPCIKFPDTNGDTYLTALQANKKIVMGAPVSFQSPIDLAAGAATLTPAAGHLAVDGRLAVGMPDRPDAMLHVASRANTTDLIVGRCVVQGDTVSLYNESGSDYTTLRMNGRTLEIQPPAAPGGKVKILGSLSATGSITPNEAA